MVIMMIMTDSNFCRRDALTVRLVTLNIPPFTKARESIIKCSDKNKENRTRTNTCGMLYWKIEMFLNVILYYSTEAEKQHEQYCNYVHACANLDKPLV